MLQTMRQNTKIILWVVVVSFVLTIFAVWGMDLQTGTSSEDPNVIGRVNGVPVTRSQYQALFEQIASQLRSATQTNELTYSQQELIETEAWNNIVMGILTDQEIGKLGITVTNNEIVSYLRSSPPPEIQPYFRDVDGNFDNEAYQAALDNPEIDWTSLEALARQRIPRLKLQHYLISQVHVSAGEIRRAYEEQNVELTIKYVAHRIDDADLAGFTPSEEDLKKYYEAHQAEFMRPESAALEIVKISIAPSARDKEDAVSTARFIHDQSVAGEVFGELARTYSEAPTADAEGKTGFLKRGQREDAYFDALDALKPGEVGPVLSTDLGHYILKLIERRKAKSGGDEYDVQEIYVAINPSRDTEDSLLTLAASVADRAKITGLKPAADEKQIPFYKPAPFDRNRPIEGLGFVPVLANFAFSNAKGALSGVLRDDANFYVAKVVDRIPESVRPFAEVQEAVSNRVIFERRRVIATRQAAAFRQKSRTTDFDTAVKTYGLTAEKPKPFRVIDVLPGLGKNSAVAEAALSMEVGNVSPPIEWRGSLYVIELLSKTPVDDAAFQQATRSITSTLLEKKVQDYITYWYDKLKAESKIEDYRRRT